MARTAIILVGGEARRANGQEKYFFQYKGKTFIEQLTNTLRGVVDEVLLVARDPEQCKRFALMSGIRCVNDQRKGIGPIGGIHAGVLASSGDELFICACDMPCIDSRVVEYLFGMLGDFDAVIPAWNPGMLEPLHAVYRKQPLLEYLDHHNSLSLRDMVSSLQCRFIDVTDLKKIDPSLITFTNINKLDDLKRIKESDPGSGG